MRICMCVYAVRCRLLFAVAGKPAGGMAGEASWGNGRGPRPGACTLDKKSKNPISSVNYTKLRRNSNSIWQQHKMTSLPPELISHPSGLMNIDTSICCFGSSFLVQHIDEHHGWFFQIEEETFRCFFQQCWTACKRIIGASASM